MNVNGKPYRTIAWSADRASVELIDQTALPDAFSILHATSLEQMAHAIVSMQVSAADGGRLSAGSAVGSALGLLPLPYLLMTDI